MQTKKLSQQALWHIKRSKTAVHKVWNGLQSPSGALKGRTMSVVSGDRLERALYAQYGAL